MNIFNKSEKKLFLKRFKKFKKEHIPQQYNQLNYVPFLLDDNLNIFLEMSNRSDGKTTTSFKFLLYEAIKCEHVRISFLVRHFELKLAIKSNIFDVMAMFPHLFDTSKLMFTEVADFSKVWYDGVCIAIIYDLNNAFDLKNHFSTLRQFPLMVWDEFLTIQEEYVSNEWIKLMTIYNSTDKDIDNPLFKHPKLLLLTNPVNFDSEILSNFDIFDVLETMEINTFQIKDEFFIEMLRNESANTKKANSILTNSVNGSLSGEFNFNRFRLINNFEVLLRENGSISIKLNSTETVICVKANNKFYLKISPPTNNETFCIKPEDETKDITFLKNNFYNESFHKKYLKGIILYANNYTKNYILNHPTFRDLNLQKLINISKPKFESSQKQFKSVIKDNLKRRFEFYD